MTVKGHALCWADNLPAFTKKLSASKLREALLEHINATMRHFQVNLGTPPLCHLAACHTITYHLSNMHVFEAALVVAITDIAITADA
jgi:Glycosyl hydrolase family 10